ncbi:fibronectin type III domain-containing protein [Candidatus Poriferisodalis sp.]|uniref:fibronectin type III domain-containing protein n=1 Tax=Candidatus Poriferisodalis sp. TaxID=3101277 RepID=UPI003D107967
MRVGVRAGWAAVAAAALASVLGLTATAVSAQQGPPAKPTGLEATEVAHDSVTLGWDDPEDDSISGYRILRRDIANQAAGTFTTLAQDTAAADTSYTDTTVEPEIHYGYRVIAINETGSSPRSLNVSLTTHAAPQQNGFGIDGTDDVYFDPEVRDAQIDPYEITMELPEGCVLHELDSDGSTPWVVTGDDCAAVDQPGPLSVRVVAQYFRLAVVAESTVTLKVVGPNSYQLYLRSADGTERC